MTTVQQGEMQVSFYRTDVKKRKGDDFEVIIADTFRFKIQVRLDDVYDTVNEIIIDRARALHINNWSIFPIKTHHNLEWELIQKQFSTPVYCSYVPPHHERAYMLDGLKDHIILWSYFTQQGSHITMFIYTPVDIKITVIDDD